MSDMELHQDFGELKGTVRALTDRVEKLTTQVENLTEALHQAKGARYALYMLMSTSGIVGGVLSYFGLKMTVGH